VNKNYEMHIGPIGMELIVNFELDPFGFRNNPPSKFPLDESV
jgi:hypothetical protein